MAGLDDARVATLIARPGTRAGAAPGAQVSKYNGMADPAGAEELAGELAARLRELTPSVIVVWEDAEDVVLGHVVARELGVRMVRAYDADGLVGTNSDLPSGARVAFVADAVRDPRVILAARALAERDGGSLVATAVLTGSAPLDAAATEAGEVIALTTPPEAEDGATSVAGANRTAAGRRGETDRGAATRPS